MKSSRRRRRTGARESGGRNHVRLATLVLMPVIPREKTREREIRLARERTIDWYDSTCLMLCNLYFICLICLPNFGAFRFSRVH